MSKTPEFPIVMLMLMCGVGLVIMGLDYLQSLFTGVMFTR